MKTRIGIIGGGNMGGAIIAGICKKYSVSVCEQDKKRARSLKKKYKITTGDLKSVVEKSRVIIVAVKPQVIDGVLEELKPALAPKTLVISIAAGITSRYIEKRLGPKVHVIRTMPNLPVQVGQGITGICPGKHAVNGDLILACRIFGCVGKTVVVEEIQMDAVTAVSGSGPAYVFLFIECLQKAAQSLGLEKNIGRELIMQTMQGSVELLNSQKADASELRARVTSKGGTTQAAVNIFQKRKFDKMVQLALLEAVKRAKSLSK